MREHSTYKMFDEDNQKTVFQGLPHMNSKGGSWGRERISHGYLNNTDLMKFKIMDYGKSFVNYISTSIHVLNYLLIN